MTRTTTLLAATVASTFCLAAAGPVSAQSAPGSARLEAVTVIAPRITYERGFRPGSGAPTQIRMTEQTAVVDASDLDLGRIADMETLKTRVDEAAARVCQELADLHPLGEPDTDECASRASKDAMAQVKTATARVASD